MCSPILTCTLAPSGRSGTSPSLLCGCRSSRCSPAWGMDKCPTWFYVQTEEGYPHTAPVRWVTDRVQSSPASHGELLGLTQAGMGMPQGDVWECPPGSLIFVQLQGLSVPIQYRGGFLNDPNSEIKTQTRSDAVQPCKLYFL